LKLDLSLFNLINGFAYKYPLIDNTMIIFSKYVPYLFMGFIVCMYVYGIYKRDINIRYAAISMLLLTAINIFFSFVIGLIYFRPRPFINNKVKLLFTHIPDASFPSDHAVGTMSIALGANNFFKGIGRILIALSIIVGISRVYVGHHYPMDVIGGFVLVFISNIVYMKFFNDKIKVFYNWCEVSIFNKFEKV
jgi:undecaprenyl-diphosphatase